MGGVRVALEWGSTVVSDTIPKGTCNIKDTVFIIILLPLKGQNIPSAPTNTAFFPLPDPSKRNSFHIFNPLKFENLFVPEEFAYNITLNMTCYMIIKLFNCYHICKYNVC